MRIYLFYYMTLVLILIGLAPITKGAPHKHKTLQPARTFTKPGKFITDMVHDPIRGGVWVATEDHGLWYMQTQTIGDKKTQMSKVTWTHYTTKDGLSSNHIYALAIDKQGRVWAGTLNQGISVFNGKTWHNYGVLTGPLGSRIFDIEVCPVDGSIWMATNLGLSRYLPLKNSWSYYTKNLMPDSLSSNSIQTLAFDNNGRLYVGTKCDGIAIGTPTKYLVNGWTILKYHHWRTVTSRYTHEPPRRPYGNGLPSNLINDILVARNGRIWVATDEGISWSNNHGKSFKFLRSQHWLDKVAGLFHAPSKSAIEQTKAYRASHRLPLLSGDHITCLAQDAAGKIWMGDWRTGFDVFNPKAEKVFTLKYHLDKGRSHVTAIVPRNNNVPLLGHYGGGITVLPKKFAAGGIAKKHDYRFPIPSLPSAATAPKHRKLKYMLMQIRRVATWHSRSRFPLVVPLPDDWRTEGNWLGRYGKYWACLCAICSPSSYIWGAGSKHINYHIQVGPHHRKHEAIRSWVQNLYTTRRDVLELPPTYLDSRIIKGYTTRQRNRRGASWDDHGETYSLFYEGPSMYCTLQIPQGRFRLSLYFLNKDGHYFKPPRRDFVIRILSHPSRLPLNKIGAISNLHVLATSRVHNFWHGVYKKFLVQGPGTITIEIDKNYSTDATIGGLFLDTFDPTPPPIFHDNTTNQTTYIRQTASDNIAGKLFQAVETIRTDNPYWWAARSNHIYAGLLRYYLSLNKKQRSKYLYQISVCQYRLNLLPRWEATLKKRGLQTARSIEKAIRWDRKTMDCSGKGRMFVMQYLKQHDTNNSNHK